VLASELAQVPVLEQALRKPARVELAQPEQKELPRREPAVAATD